jgi:glutamate racemase
VFDSGLGGLTAVRELKKLLPREHIVYFGDTGRVPYGGRSRETILKYARQDVAFLRTFDLKAVVIACGTVSATALEVLAAENSIPLLGWVEPAGLAAVAAHPQPEGRPYRYPGLHPQRRLRKGDLPRGPSVRITAAPCPCWSRWWKTGASAPATSWPRRSRPSISRPSGMRAWTPWCWAAPIIRF